MEAFVFPLVALTVFLIFTEVLTVDIFYYEDIELNLNLNILGIKLTPERVVKRNEKRKNKKKSTKKEVFSTLIPAINFLLHRSEVEIKHLSVEIKQSEASEFFIRKGICLSFINSFMILLEGNSKIFAKENIIITTSDNNNIKFYVKLTVPLLHVLTALFVYLKERFFRKRRKINNVGS